MKNLTKIVMLVLLTIITLSCYKQTVGLDDNKNNSKRKTNKLVLSGESIFREIFFLEGSISNELPSLSQRAKALNDISTKNENVAFYRKDLADDLIKNIKDINPNFFSKFQQKIKSDDYFEVQSILKESGDILQQAGLLSQKYGNVFRLGTKILNNPNLLAQIKQIDISTEQGKIQLGELIKQNQLEPNEMLGCVPAAAVCVYYVIAAVHSIAVATVTVIGAANMIAYYTVMVKGAFLFWEVISIEGKTIMDEVFVKEIADYF